MNIRAKVYLEATNQKLEDFKAYRFIIWIGDKWDEWCKLNNKSYYGLNEKDHAEFDKWLKNNLKEGKLNE